MEHKSIYHNGTGGQASNSAGSRSGTVFRGLAGGLFGVRWVWFFLVRNRLAIAIASLIWLLFRSGTKPQRLAYPCQQVAAANVGAVFGGLITVLFLGRNKKSRRVMPMLVAIPRQLAIAGVMFVVGLVAIEGYQYANTPDVCPLPNAPARTAPNEKAVVAIVKADQELAVPLDDLTVANMVRRAVALAGGVNHLMVDGNGGGVTGDGIKVVIKPNLVQTMWQPGEGVTTDPRVVRELVYICQEAGADEVIIAEGSASYRNSDFIEPVGVDDGRWVTRKAFHDSGYDTDYDMFEDETGVALVDLNDCGGLGGSDNVREVKLANAAIRKDPLGYMVPEILLDCDVLISVPTLKNHGNGSVTMSLKNRVGCAPNDIYNVGSSFGGGYINQMKWEIVHSIDRGYGANVSPLPASGAEDEIVQRSLVDLNLCRPQDFALIDGLVGIENGPVGPGDGTVMPVPMELMIAGADSVAVDAVGTCVMGYHPDYVPHLAWANAMGELGTLDRGWITVVGDRVSMVRHDFQVQWDEYCQTARAESDRPSITGTSVGEGALLAGGQVVTASGMSTEVVQVAAVTTLLGENLLENGEFDGTSTGWTEWQENSGWGTGEYWQYDNPDTGDGSDYSLRLGNENTSSSFGVYQTVTVEPGKTYRLDAMWKGQKMVNMNWWEVILIDGPFSYLEADTDPDVRDNYMYAYDNNTYGWPGGIGTGWDWEWCHENNAPPLNQVDWKNRAGRRTATGNVMTVVLKAGAYPGTPGIAAWFDSVSLREVGDDVVLASVPNPNPTEQSMTLDPPDWLDPNLEYPAELRMTVQDNVMNDDVIYRNVSVKSTPLDAWVCVDVAAIDVEVFVGQDANPDVINVWNCGLPASTLNYNISWTATDWLAVVPDSGQAIEGDPANAHTVAYTTSHLAPSATPYSDWVTVQGPANEQRVKINVTVTTVKPDFDSDGDVDQADFGFLQKCLTGNQQVSGLCEQADLNEDGFVNQNDFGRFQSCISGANMLPDETCDD